MCRIHGNQVTMELNFYVLAFQVKRMNFAFNLWEEKKEDFFFVCFVLVGCFFLIEKVRSDPADF